MNPAYLDFTLYLSFLVAIILDMNWTGGRLQRSKADAKTLVKTQKQHFAKARLRLHNGLSTQSPFALSIPHRQYGHHAGVQDDMHIGGYHQHRKRSRSHDAFYDKHKRRVHSHESRHHKQNSLDEPQPKKRRSEHALDREHGDISAMVAGVGKHEHTRAWEMNPNQAGVVDYNRKSTATEANTLQSVKRKLLAKSDWMGLSAARPLKMEFATVEEMENIGKRRKLTKAYSKRAAADQPHSRFDPAVNRHHHIGQHGSNASILHTEDASVRIGSNIPQTQPTQQLTKRGQPTPNASRGVSTESMLFDFFDGEASFLDRTRKAEVLRPTDGQHLLSPRLLIHGESGPAFPDPDQVSKYTECRSRPGRAYTSSTKERSELDIERIFPTLDQLRDSKNFDELKARSTSRSSKVLSFPSPPLPRPMAQKETAKRCGESRRRRVLPSSENGARPVCKNSLAEQPPLSCEDFKKGQNTPAHLKLPTEFWPKRPTQLMSQTHVEMHDQSYPSECGVQSCLPMNLDALAESTTEACASAAKPRCQEDLVEVSLPRPVFTLEHQVSDEAMARSGTDASQISPLDLRKNMDSIVMTSSLTRSNPSLTKSPRRSSHYGVSPHHTGPLSNRRDDGSIFKTPSRNATRSDTRSLGVRSTKDRSLNPLTGKGRTPSQYSTEITLQPNVMTRQFGPTLCDDLLITRQIQHYDNRPSDSPSGSSCRAMAKDQEVNENEARIECVIPWFNEVRNDFQFQPKIRWQKANGRSRNSHKVHEAGEMTGTDKCTWTPHSTRVAQNTSPAKSIHTFANSVLHRADDLPSSRRMIGTGPLETAFPTQISPMEGKVDEGLADISVDNNAPRNSRSFITAPRPLTRSPRPIQSATNVEHAHSSGLDTTPLKQMTGAVLPDVQDANVEELKWISSELEWLPGSRSTHRQPLQASTDMPVVYTRQFDWTPQAKRKSTNPSRNCPGPDLHRPSYPRPDLARALQNDGRTLRTPGQSMISIPPKDTPIREIPRDSNSGNCWTTTSGFLNLSQAFSVQAARCGLVEAVQRDQTAGSFPMHHESTPQEGQTPSTPGTHTTAIFDEYPFADEDALYMLSTDTLGTYSRSPDPISSTAGPRPFLHNIHTRRNQPSTFKKPAPFVGKQVTVARGNDGFEAPLLSYRAIGSMKRRTSVVGKFKMPNKATFMGDFVAEDIESMSNM